MTRLLKNLFGLRSPETPRRDPPDRRAKLGLEALDRRDVPAYLSLSYGQLGIIGGAGGTCRLTT